MVSPIATHSPRLTATRGTPHATVTGTIERGTSTPTRTSTKEPTAKATPTEGIHDVTPTVTSTGSPVATSTATATSGGTHTPIAGGTTEAGTSSTSNSKSVSSARSSSGEGESAGEVHVEAQSGHGATYGHDGQLRLATTEAVVGSYTPQEGYTATLRPATVPYSPMAPNVPVRDAQKPTQLPNAGDGTNTASWALAGVAMIALPVVEYLRRRKNGKT